jgi:hypothetical protein
MRNLLALVALAVIVLAGLGYYKEWYTFKAVAAPDGHKTYTVDVDAKKIQDAVNTGKKEVSDVLHGK